MASLGNSYVRKWSVPSGLQRWLSDHHTQGPTWFATCDVWHHQRIVGHSFLAHAAARAPRDIGVSVTMFTCCSRILPPSACYTRGWNGSPGAGTPSGAISFAITGTTWMREEPMPITATRLPLKLTSSCGQFPAWYFSDGDAFDLGALAFLDARQRYPRPYPADDPPSLQPLPDG